MNSSLLNGSYVARLDDKNRFVLPQPLRYGLVEEGVLPPLMLGLGIGGCLVIYRKKEMDEMIERLSHFQYQARYQKFFTLFFSTLHLVECDRVGRIALPPVLKKAARIEKEIMLAGVLNKIEIWKKDDYEQELETLMQGSGENIHFKQMEEVFSLLSTKTEKQKDD